MVVRANKISSELGGHVASFASAATLYDVGFNHFFRAPSEKFGGDLVFFQGHSSPGVYARAFLEGRIDEAQLENFRQEVDGKGLSSYPHPWLMPAFWQFPTVSMGLGPIMSIYQARFMRYLHDRGLTETSGRKVWAFVGDGETDEPETLGAISLAGREKLDDLIWVVNCNLQRLDGPVRGNGKIVQELEGVFKGAGIVARSGVTLEVDQIAQVFALVPAEKVVKAHLIKGGTGGEGGNVAPDPTVLAIGIDHHRDRVPANIAFDLAF